MTKSTELWVIAKRSEYERMKTWWANHQVDKFIDAKCDSCREIAKFLTPVGKDERTYAIKVCDSCLDEYPWEDYQNRLAWDRLIERAKFLIEKEEGEQ